MNDEREVQFETIPDPADLTFDGNMPVLTFERGQAGGPGWVLYSPDGAESFYLGGDPDDVDWAEEVATTKFVMLAEGEDI
jgi:hypothetical protein